MKILSNIIRTLLFTVLIGSLIPILYAGLGWLAAYATNGIYYLYERLNVILFWIVFFGVITTFLRMVWILFQSFSRILVRLSNKICPYGGYACWATLIIAIISFGLFEYGYWNGTGWPSFMIGVVGIVVSFLAFGLLGAILEATYKEWFGGEQYSE